MGGTLSQKISGEDVTRTRANTHIALPETKVHSSNLLLDSEDIELEFKQTYEVLRLLGRGASAEVNLVRHRETNKEYACKVVRKSNKMNDTKTMKTETTIMKKLEDEHLLRMVELYETEDAIWMVLEFADGGDLMHGLASLPVYNERAVANVFKQILLGVKYLHCEGIVHRDLKLDNILYSTPTNSDEAMQVKIADFGLSALTNVKRTSNNSQRLKSTKALTEMWGTVEYFAPEVYERKYGSQADIWALGCILFEMLTGELAFPHRENKLSFVDKVMAKSQLKKKPVRLFEQKAGWKDLSPEAQSMIRGMLKRNATTRFDIDECLSHPWITGDSLNGSMDVELVRTKNIVKQRSERRLQRYENLINQMKKAEDLKQRLTPVKVA